MNGTSPTIRLQLDSRPECVALVRSAISAVGERLALDRELLDDLRTAVSEACNNVVQHAYDDALGPLVVVFAVVRGDVEVIVGDWGGGIRHIAAAAPNRMGVGLALISALAQRAEFLSRPGGGTEVRMLFARSGPMTSTGAVAEHAEPAAGAPERHRTLVGDVVVQLTPVSMLAAVLGRVARALAASSRFSIDRFSDVYLVTDAVAVHAEQSLVGVWVTFALAASTRRLELTLGPLAPGRSGELARQHRERRVQSPLVKLADELSVSAAAEGELLRVVMTDRRPSVLTEA